MAAGYDKHECTICMEDFNKPKLLPCHHTFCEDCISGQIQTRAENNKFPCPVCRTITDVPAGGARGFQTNVYLVMEEDKLFCSKHKKMKMKFYCRDCSEIVCGDCVVIKHTGHKVDDLATVEDETKQQLKPLTKQLKEKVAELKTFSENLKHTLSHINTTADIACKNVDTQTERICQKLRELAQDIKNNIIQIQDDSNKTVHKMMEDINRLITEIETGVNCSRDVLTGKTTSKSAVDILPNIQTLIEYGRQTSVDLPEVKCPLKSLFPLVDIDTQSLKKILGALETEKAASLSVRFNAMEIGEDEWYNSDEYMIHGTHWCVSVKRDTSDLYVYLGLKEEEDEREYSCTADTTLKLLNTTDDSQSVVEKRERKESDWESSCMLSIEWEKVTDPNNGFLQDNIFTLVALVNVIEVVYEVL